MVDGRLRLRREDFREQVDHAGAEQRARLLPTISLRLTAAIEQAERWAAEGRPGWRQQWSLPEPYRHGGGFKRDLAFLEAISSELIKAVA